MLHLLYLSTIVLLVASSSLVALGEATGALIVLGVVGAWRYSWAAINFSRAALFLNFVFPRRKRAAIEREEALGIPRHAFVMITTYKIEPDVTSRVYQDLFAATERWPHGATVVASVVDPADERLIRAIYESSGPRARGNTRLIIDRIAGTGKRDAIARSLEILRRHSPTRHDIIAFVDGDSSVPLNLFEAAAPFFSDPEVGALTTDEAVEIPTPGLFRDWFDLRFAQRQVMMSSMGLSERVLTLTGRMSVFRACLATDPSFIDQVKDDQIDHWRLGRINFLTGDDKSTWFWLLSRGYKMLYLPDVASVSMETQPKPGFVESAIALMKRWYGNMLRTNARAADLSPSTIGHFTWWSLRDQKLSIWTTLSGPLAVLLTAIFLELAVIPAYIAWVMGTRYVYCGIISTFRGRWFPISNPFLLYFGQIVGAAVKSYVLFRLDRQKWTRQSASTGPQFRFVDLGSAVLHAVAIGWIVLALATFTLSTSS